MNNRRGGFMPPAFYAVRQIDSGGVNPPLRPLLCGEKNMKKIFDIVTQRNVLFLIISIIFALPFISFAPFVKTVDNVDYFTLKNDPDVEFYDKFNLTQCPNSSNHCINIR
jgi:hypothetical protein